MDENKAHYVSATGIVIKDRKYLITKRAGNLKTFPNMWTVPGGKLELNDYINLKKDTSQHWYNILENLLRREIKEEVGIEVKNIKYLTSMTFVRPDGIPTLIIGLFADHHNGDVKLNEELIDYAWVSLEEAKNYSLIEGIYEELEMLDKYLKGENIGEWGKQQMNNKIIEEVKKFVEKECNKPTSNYGNQPYEEHFIPMVKYAKELAKKSNADEEIVEIAAWLHDIGSIKFGRENHHISGAKVAEEKLIGLGYDKAKIERVKECIYSHRGSQNIKPKTKEAEIIREADGLDIFDRIEGLFRGALVYEKLTAKEARQSVKKHIVDSWNKLSEESKELIRDKYNAAMLLLK